MRSAVWAWVWAWAWASVGAGALATHAQQPRCEEITIPMCRGIGYNLTAFPNALDHDTQEEAGLEVCCRLTYSMPNRFVTPKDKFVH
ncbi:jg9706 [Pararge aegeria aegeria]|uniref:Jg9706 protein n=1 Tax=Pararge aegeria aegeria TaxID=348720 RepID=A0A8S4SQW8_9NEOP|nr:jg9706 [Pararge aegeria aegeria]